MNSSKILAVGDEPSGNMEYAISLLGGEGYSVTSLRDETKTEYEMKNGEFDLVLLDSRVGESVVNSALGMNVPIFFMISDPSPAAIRDVYLFGGCDYITAPIVKSEFLTRIKTQLLTASKQKEIDNVNAELHRFCLGVSHDMKAPFTVICMLVNMLSDALGDNKDNDTNEIMTRIVSDSTNVKTMIEDMYERTKIYS